MRLLTALLFCAPAWGNSPDLKKLLQQLSPVKLTADISQLPHNELKVLNKVIEAARGLDPLFLRQVWEGNPELSKKLQKDSSKKGELLLQLFKQHAGPWSRLSEDAAFVSGVPAHPPLGAGFYPLAMTKEEFEKWASALPADQKETAIGFFSVIEKDSSGRLIQVPYSQSYADYLTPVGKLLKQAAELTSNESLKKYLNLRSEAFSSNNYYESDLAWMDLDAPIDVTIGPYETYEDKLFGYKAAFEAFIGIKNQAESAKLEKFGAYLQELEDHLPLEPKYRNPKIGASAPIRVLDLVFTAGDARRGIMTAAFNLPNDERVITKKGSKRVMLKNVQQAKFERVLLPISSVVLSKADQKKVAFDPFFTHILMHELMHGLGPHDIKVKGQGSTVRAELKEQYSAIEEAKADITGLWAMHYLMDKQVVDPKMRESMNTTYLASAFRSVRFGVGESHGRGIALQFNYLSDEGAIVARKNGTFFIDEKKMLPAVTKLSRELLTIEAQGNYAKAKSLLAKYAVIRPAMERALSKLKSVPTDISPSYPLAGE